MVVHPTTALQVTVSNPGRLGCGGAERLVSSAQFTPRPNPSEHKLTFNPPTPTPTRKKKISRG